MAVTLLHDEERLRWEHQDTQAGFIYRRPPIHVIRKIQASHTQKGIVDTDAVILELMEWCLYDWFGFVDHHGAPVSYNKTYIPRIPETMKAAFMQELHTVDPIREELPN